MENTSRTKKLVLINREFQLKYAKISFCVGIITTFLTAFVILYPLYIFEVLRVPKFLPVPILIAMTSTAFINIFALAVMGVIITHRVAGPMYALFREIRKIGSGDFSVRLRTREQDEFSFIIRNFNEMAENLREDTIYDLNLLEELEKAVDKELKPNAIKDTLGKLRFRMEGRLDGSAADS